MGRRRTFGRKVELKVVDDFDENGDFDKLTAYFDVFS